MGAFVGLVLDAVATTYDMHLWLCQFQLSPRFKALRVRKLYEKDQEVTRRWRSQGSRKDPKDRPWVVQPTTGITLGTFLYFYSTYRDYKDL